jgi:hypothetical protein
MAQSKDTEVTIAARRDVKYVTKFPGARATMAICFRDDGVT